MTQSLVPYDRPYTAPDAQVAIAGAQGVYITMRLFLNILDDADFIEDYSAYALQEEV
jgi:hypothetical protein